MTASEYWQSRNQLMEKWEAECRNWLDGSNATFFRDGVIDPDIWFSSSFRPLFILKEVHDKKPKGGFVDFTAMNDAEGHDIWNRVGMWHSLGTLAKGIICGVQNLEKMVPYETLYAEKIDEYRKTLRQIAVINIKKLSGGSNVKSDKSKETKNYTCHACKFSGNLQEQIEIIQPSVIICCGSELKNCFDIKDGKIYGFPVVMGLHPATNPNCRRKAFYDDTIEKVRNVLSK